MRNSKWVVYNIATKQAVKLYKTFEPAATFARKHSEYEIASVEWFVDNIQIK